MPRFLLLALLALLLLVPATADGKSSVRLRGTVAAKDAGSHLVSMKSSRQLFSLRAPGSLSSVRVGQRVELHGSTLRAQARGSRVLARGVTIASSHRVSTTTRSSSSDDEPEDDEVEITGKITSLAPLLTVASATHSATCAVPTGMSLSGFAVGDLVEITCDLVGSVWTLRKIHLEDDDDAAHGGIDDDDDGDDDRGHDDDDNDDDDDSSGPGEGDDDESDDD